VAPVGRGQDCICFADADGRLLSLNPTGRAILGLADPAAIRARHLRDLFAPADRIGLAEAMLEAARRDGVWQGPAMLLDGEAGGTRPVDCTCLLLPDIAGQAGGFALLAHDPAPSPGTEQGRAALVELADRLDRLDDPDTMAYEAAAIMGRALAASRAGYGLVDPISETVDIARDWTAPGVASIAGRYAFATYGSYIADLRRGDTVVLADVAHDPRTADSAAAWHALGAHSVVNLPIFERGAFVAVFFIQQSAPRVWTREELAFLRDAAERTRAATERRRAEAGLRALAASLERQVAERTEDRDRLWRLATDIMMIARFDGVILAINPAASAVLGWSEQELVGSLVYDLVHPEDLDRSRARAARLEAGETLPPAENRYRHRDGSYRWISWNVVAGGGRINAIGRHTTAERERAAALALSEARLRSVFETSYSFQGWLAPDGTVLDANRAALAAIGAARETVIGRRYWETPWFAATPDAAAFVAEAVPRVAAGETQRRELVLDLPTGRRAFDFSLRPAQDAAGAVIGLVPEAMEVTERRAAEEQLRQAQKMEAVGQLTGGLAHDFNNLLAGISGSLELLQLRVAQGRLAESERYIAAAQGGARRAASLTHRLLAFSRQQTLDPKPLSPNRLIGGLEELVRRTIGPQITLQTVLAIGVWPILCDRNQLENALLNLCINARDAMPQGGRLTIETANTWLDEAGARARDMAPGQYVALCVTDTGVGMTRSVLARAFDPFFTTKKPGEGTGLGLSMIYGFAKQSGGEVRLYSEPGQGTTVRLYLPRYFGLVAEEAAAPGTPPAASRGEVVLVVDDEPLVRMLVIDVLTDLGYGAIEAADGPAGLAALRAAERVDLMITDVGLPGGMNGRQLAETARQERPTLPVLFITGYAENAVLASLPRQAGMHVLAKPFGVDALVARIRAMVGERR
jgi:PAS domain S-box-containing protein